jgi:DNA-binding NarL/FixJ family response regulator
MTLRVVVVDDQALVRGGIRMILESEPDIEVTAEADDGEAAVHLVQQFQPDVVLMDVRMSGIDGIEATRRIVTSGSGSKVVMLTTFDQDENVYKALRAGASGFLLKSSPPSTIIDGVRLAAAGECLFAPSVTKRLVEHYVRQPPTSEGTPPALLTLTERELEVLGLLATGLSNAEIATTLFLSEATVKTHVSRILTKLDLRDRVQAVIAAYECGFVSRNRPDQ